MSVVIKRDGLNISISTHEEWESQILSKIKKAGVLMETACSEVTDSSINRYKNDVGGQLQQQAGSNYIIIDTALKVKSIFDRVQGTVFDRFSR